MCIRLICWNTFQTIDKGPRIIPRLFICPFPGHKHQTIGFILPWATGGDRGVLRAVQTPQYATAFRRIPWACRIEAGHVAMPPGCRIEVGLAMPGDSIPEFLPSDRSWNCIESHFFARARSRIRCIGSIHISDAYIRKRIYMDFSFFLFFDTFFSFFLFQGFLLTLLHRCICVLLYYSICVFLYACIVVWMYTMGESNSIVLTLLSKQLDNLIVLN